MRYPSEDYKMGAEIIWKFVLITSSHAQKVEEFLDWREINSVSMYVIEESDGVNAKNGK